MTRGILSKLNRSFEDEVRRAGEFDVGEAIAGIGPTDFQGVAPLHLHLDGRGEPMDPRRHQRRGGDTGAARQGFAFHPALVGADPDSPGAEQLDEVDVGALGLEMWMEALALGTALPTLPLWIGRTESLPLDLEQTYQAACAARRID